MSIEELSKLADMKSENLHKLAFICRSQNVVQVVKEECLDESQSGNCPKCPRTFKTNFGLREHIKSGICDVDISVRGSEFPSFFAN